MSKAIAVLGGGNGGRCMAADLTLRGFRVNLYEHRDFKNNFQDVLDQGTLLLTGIGPNGLAKIEKVTLNMEEAVEDVSIVNIVVPSFAHELYFNEIIPFLKDGTLIILWCGNFGSLRFLKLLQEKYPEKDVIIAETHTLPYGIRIRPDGSLDYHVRAPKVLLSSLPAKHTHTALEKIQNIWPCLEKGDNVISTALSNPNTLCHPAGTLLNTGRIQYSNGEFYLYKEGITEAVARVIKSVYNETSALANALESEVIKYQDYEFMTPASIMSVALQAPFNTLQVMASLVKGPSTVNDRYLTEDIPYSLVPISCLGKRLNVPTPIIDALINIGCIVCNEDFWKTGRTLNQLGIEKMEKADLMEFLY